MLQLLISILVPEISAYSDILKEKYIKQVREKLAYELDEKKLYLKFGYRKLINKSESQNRIIQGKTYSQFWFMKYLSDYFNLNILMIYQGIIIKPNPIINAPCLILIKEEKKIKLLQLASKSILSASLGKQILDLFPYHLTEWKSISHYKSPYLKELSKQVGYPEKPILKKIR